MSASKIDQTRSGRGVTIQLNLATAVILGVSLVAAAGVLTYALVTSVPQNADVRAPAGWLAKLTGRHHNSDSAAGETPPYGELLTSDIELGLPREYVAFKADTSRITRWVFGGMTADQVRALMISCGLTSDQAERALAPALASAVPSGLVVQPDDQLVLSLTPQARAKLYQQLARDRANADKRFPVHRPRQTFNAWLREARLDAAAAAVLRKLTYECGDDLCFSDFGPLLRQVPDESQRLLLVKVLLRQPAVLAQLRIRPDTDVEKVIGYWAVGPNIRFKDIRPLLDSLKRLPEGGCINLLHLLPPFARQRLYTFPQPGRPADPALNCDWSTMNFFNATPDDRFVNPAYTSTYVAVNFYQVAKPTLYGDLIFFFDDHNVPIHSAVYIAGDIVFTRRGDGFDQPWALMRLEELTAGFTANAPIHVAVYRNIQN